MTVMHQANRSASSVTTDVSWPEHDLRQLACPEPMQRTIDLADALTRGESVCVLTPRSPTPLLDVLQGRGLQTCVSVLASGGARVWIRRPEHDGPTGD